MKETSPGLHQKIVAEDKAVESRTRDYLENNKPVEGHMRPDEALQRLQLSEIKDSSFKNEDYHIILYYFHIFHIIFHIIFISYYFIYHIIYIILYIILFIYHIIYII